MGRTVAQQKWYEGWRKETIDKLWAMGIPCCLAHEQQLNEACCEVEKVLSRISRHIDLEE